MPTSVTLSEKAADGSGKPTGAAMASSGISAASISSSLSTVRATFSAPVTIMALTQYPWVLLCSDSSSGMRGNYVGCRTATNSYAGGRTENLEHSPWAG